MYPNSAAAESQLPVRRADGFRNERIIHRANAPKTMRIEVKLAASMVRRRSAARHNNEFAAKATIAIAVRRRVRRNFIRCRGPCYCITPRMGKRLMPRRPDHIDDFHAATNCDQTAEDAKQNVPGRDREQAPPNQKHAFVTESGKRGKSAEKTGEKKQPDIRRKQIMVFS